MLSCEPSEGQIETMNRLKTFLKNNLYDLAGNAIMQLKRFPRNPKPRRDGDIDNTGNVFDTVWKETCGMMEAPQGSVPFRLNYFIASNINKFISVLEKNDPAELAEYSTEFSATIIDNIISMYVEDSVGTYLFYGYVFEPFTLGSTRPEDVFELMQWWEKIDTRTCKYALSKIVARKTEYTDPIVLKLIDVFDRFFDKSVSTTSMLAHEILNTEIVV